MALDVLVGDYEELKYTLSGTVSKGDFVTLNDTNGFLMVDGVSGDVATLIVKARKAKATLDAVTASAGEAAYIVTASGLITNDSDTGSNPLIGYFIEDCASGETAYISFDGTLAFAKA